jgi:hypothetical protein
LGQGPQQDAEALFQRRRRGQHDGTVRRGFPNPAEPGGQSLEDQGRRFDCGDANIERRTHIDPPLQQRQFVLGQLRFSLGRHVLFGFERQVGALDQQAAVGVARLEGRA